MAQAALQRDTILELDPKPNRAPVLVIVQAMGKGTKGGGDVSGNLSATATARGNPDAFHSTAGSGTAPRRDDPAQAIGACVPGCLIGRFQRHLNVSTNSGETL
jgi:hypothetical protein